MSITTMCDANEPGAFLSEYWTKQTGHNIYLHEHHVGVVLSLGEMNGRDDSDFYAIVWNAETGETERYVYASTRGWSYCNGASVDATDEVKAAYSAYVERNRAAAKAQRERCAAATPTKGKLVRFIRGTTTKGVKVPKDAEGEVFWYGEARQFGPVYRNGYKAAGINSRRTLDSWMIREDGNREGYRIGVKLTNGTKIFTSATNVEVIDAGAAN